MRPFRSLAAGLLIATVASRAAAPQAFSPSQVRDIDSIFAAYDHPGVPGASVIVIRDGAVVLSRAYGMADLEARVPATERTSYRLASVTKQFTATAILLLVRDGKLHLDDHVIDLLPGFPAYAKAVTVRQLLTHTSGLWAYEDFVPDTAAQVKQAGISAVPQRAYGYSKVKRGSGFRRTDQSSTSATLGDGGIYTSTHDLVKWSQAIDEHTLIDSPAQKLAWTTQTLNDGTVSNYGFGWNVGQTARGLHVWHTGETRGFRNAIVKYPDQSLTVIVLTNRSESEPLPLAEHIVAMQKVSSP